MGVLDVKLLCVLEQEKVKCHTGNGAALSCTMVLGFLVSLHIAHCSQSHDYSIGMRSLA